MSEVHPAIVAAQNSWRCVQNHDKEGWLELMADDICVEDPIGEATTNPTGKGVRGKADVSKFYDTFIGPADVVVETHKSNAAGNESAHVLTLHTTLPNGTVTHVNGIFTYNLNDAGKITALRGYWTMADMTVDHPSG